MTKSKILWTDRVWNPVSGCTQISDGCKNCYAKRQARRLATIRGSGYDSDVAHPYDGMGFDVTVRPWKLEEPLRWKKPCKVFVCSMGDLFHKKVPLRFINKMFDVMEKAPHHEFMLLTKRPDRMFSALRHLGENRNTWPLPNVTIGITVENQKTADERISILAAIPAAKRFISCEPLLENIELGFGGCFAGRWEWMDNDLIDLVICGGESGPNARPMHPNWALSLRDQCAKAQVPFMFKQWGEWQHGSCMSKPNANRMVLDDGRYCVNPADLGFNSAQSGKWNAYNPTMMSKVGNSNSGRILDGRTWDGTQEEVEQCK